MTNVGGAGSVCLRSQLVVQVCANINNESSVMEIISVDINSLVIPKYCHYHTSFVVLFDPTVEEIISKAEHDSKCLFLVFSLERWMT